MGDRRCRRWYPAPCRGAGAAAPRSSRRRMCALSRGDDGIIGLAPTESIQANMTEQAPIDLYYWTTPNGHKITIFLEEAGLPYRLRPVNITRNEQQAPAFVAISPNGRIPAIVDPSPAHGAGPQSMFESGAILLYLAEKTGRFLPRDPLARIPVHEWLMWQMGGFGPMPGQVHHFVALKDEADRRYGLARYQQETERLYAVMDRRLADREYFADEVSIADFAIIGWAWRHERHRVDLARYPHVQRWYATMMARPGTRRGFEVALS